jgi:uncharacterized membrane protein
MSGKAKPTVPDHYSHAHPPVRNVNRLHKEQMNRSERLSDRLTDFLGSWAFLTWQGAILAVWIIVNLVGWLRHWDPYPFIFLNLILNFQESFAAPIIMMSQNRMEIKDRFRAEEDYQVNVKAEEEVAIILQHLEAQSQQIAELKETVAALTALLEPAR